MKKRFLIILCLALAVLLCSCNIVDRIFGGDESQMSSFSESHTLSQLTESSNDDELESEQTHIHEFTSEIVAPVCVERGYTTHTCECGYYFVDTFVDGASSHSFERGICTLCAEIDYPELINIISTETIKANVSVKVQFSNKSFGMGTQIVGISNGSGVIFKKTDTEYYALTNNHVVYCKDLEATTQYTSYYIVDYSGKEYRADCIARLAEYDLAIMKFSSTEEYTVLDLEIANSEQGDFVVSLGQPEGQSNAITLGNSIDYGRVDITKSDPTETNVTFDVLYHDAYINSGSSGGALLDAELNIIGINYAGDFDANGSCIGSYAIPVEKVYEFFEKVAFEYDKPGDDDAERAEQDSELESDGIA